jgi:hypothetical protein
MHAFSILKPGKDLALPSFYRPIKSAGLNMQTVRENPTLQESLQSERTRATAWRTIWVQTQTQHCATTHPPCRKGKHWLWLYHKWQNEYIKRNDYKTKNYSYTNFLCLHLFPTTSLSMPYLSHFTTLYINSHTLHMHAPHIHTHTQTHTPLKKEEPKVTQTMHPWIHRQKS